MKSGRGITAIAFAILVAYYRFRRRVPALAAGTYQLLCDVHPDMRSQLVVAP